jgi:hypothetical protein
MEFARFERFTGILKSYLENGDVAWVVGIRYGSKIEIDNRMFVVKGMADREHRDENHTLCVYVVTDVSTNEELDVVFLSDNQVYMESKIKYWSWDFVQPKRARIVSEEEEETTDDDFEATDDEFVSQDDKRYIKNLDRTTIVNPCSVTRTSLCTTWCCKCNVFRTRDSFSAAMSKEKNDCVRYCLLHTSSSSFGQGAVTNIKQQIL